MSSFTAKTLEDMFVYLGCANLDTSVVLDGAIPLESINADKRDLTLRSFNAVKVAALPDYWNLKGLLLNRINGEDSIKIVTARNCHWSVVANQASKYKKWFLPVASPLEASDFAKDYTSSIETYVSSQFAEIDRNGKFVKFPVTRRTDLGGVVSRYIAPHTIFAFKKNKYRIEYSDVPPGFKIALLDYFVFSLCSIAQNLGSFWQVRARFDSVCPSLTLLTDPTGVKEFWKLRDVPEGKKRRSALLHWVEDHWRKHRHDPDVEVYVRKHMRGQQVLRQGKMVAKIIPAVSDYMDAAKAARIRKEMRKRKLDRRKRKALK